MRSGISLHILVAITVVCSVSCLLLGVMIGCISGLYCGKIYRKTNTKYQPGEVPVTCQQQSESDFVYEDIAFEEGNNTIVINTNAAYGNI